MISISVSGRWHALAPVLLGAACSGDVAPPPKLMDTGWFDTGTVGPPDCQDKLVSTRPEGGTVGWYWRDRPVLTTETANPAGYSAWLQEASGERLQTGLEWDDPSGLVATVTWDGHLEANTDYVLGVEDCTQRHTVAFRTSEFGRPLIDGPATIQGNTYLLDLIGATWTEPAVLAQVISLYFTTPVLLGVKAILDEQQIDLLGAPGIVNELGVVKQDKRSPTWPFPLADFTSSPYLEARAEQITLQYRDGSKLLDIPVEDFLFQATFSADGTRLGGGILSGLADTRHIGALIDNNDPAPALCNLASSLGVNCQPCADGMPYCLRLVGRDIVGDVVPGLKLEASGD